MGLLNEMKDLLNEQLGTNIPDILSSKPNQDQTKHAVNSQTGGGLYDPQMEQLIDMALADGELTEKEKQVLFKRAESMGIDLDEFEMVLDARLYKLGQRQQSTGPTATSAPKSDKYGDVKKCPSCGAMIESFTARCPECGHEFSNITANSSIQKLFEMLNQVEVESHADANTLIGSFLRIQDERTVIRRKKTIIQNFPIPTTKDDILEFLSLAVPLARKPGLFSQDETAKTMYPVWKAKCEQIIMKAKFSMKEDKKTLDMIKEYADELKIKM